MSFMVGTPVDPAQMYGTRDPELIERLNNIVYANWVDPKFLEETIRMMDDATVANLVERRYRKESGTLHDRLGFYKSTIEKLSHELFLDFEILQMLISQGRLLDNTPVDASLYTGEHNPQNLIGVLEQYRKDIADSKVNIPMISAKNEPIIDSDTNQVCLANQFVEFLIEQAKKIEQEHNQGQTLN